MGLFDDVSDIDAGGGERGVQADPDALASTWDALSEYTDAVARRAADDPVGTVLAGVEAVSPPPSIEFEGDADGITGVTTSSQFGKSNARIHDDGHLTADVNFSAGPAGGLKGNLVTDASGNVTKIGGEAKLEVDNVGAEAKGSYEETADGWKGSGSLGASVPVEGVPLKGEVRGGYEDMGDRGFKATGGAGVGVGAKSGDGMVEGSVMKGTDLDYSDVDGQQTYGVRESTTIKGEVAGQEAAAVRVESGVAYTTGPDGERVIVHTEVSGRAGTDSSGTVSGGLRQQREWGTDAQGNEVDRTTTTVRGDAKSEPLGIDEHVSSTSVEEDVDVIGTPLRPGEMLFDAIDPDLRRPDPTPRPAPADVPLDAINPDLRRPGPGPRPAPADIPLDAIDPDFRRPDAGPSRSTSGGPPESGRVPVDPGREEGLEEPLLGGEMPASRTDRTAPIAWEETPDVSATVVESVEIDRAAPIAWEETPDVSETVVERVTYEPTYERQAESAPADYSTEYPLE